MPKSYRLLGDGNYIDSTGIAHNKVALNTVIANLQNADISAINNLTSTDTKNALSAAQGKILAEQIQDKSPIMIYNTDSNDTIKEKLLGSIANIDESEGWITVKSMIFAQSTTDENVWLPLSTALLHPAAEEYWFTFTGIVNKTYVSECIKFDDTYFTTAVTNLGIVINQIQNDLLGGNTSINSVLHANQGKILNDKIVALEARIAAFEAGEIELATDPDDTDEMNVWIQTS